MNNFVWILPALFVAMVIQVVLSMMQYQRFYGRVRQMRKDSGGRAAIGMSGSNWRSKAYGVLIVNDQDVIIHAEKLTGLTVFARLKSVENLTGLPLTRLESDEPVEGISSKLWKAFQHAKSFFDNKTQDALETSKRSMTV